ncbi:MAG: hypothetical protein ACOCTU_07465 [Bacteroidota bacterium]
MKKILISALIIFICSHYSYSQLADKAQYRGDTTWNFKHFDAFISENSENEAGGQLDVRVFVLPGLSIGGVGENLGSEVESFEKNSWEDDESPNEGDYQSDYGDRTMPIITDPEANLPFNVELGYTYKNTRIGVSWFRMEASDAQSGEVPGYKFQGEETSEDFRYGFVSFWNMGWDLHTSRNFPASWVEGFRDIDENEEEDYELEFFPEKGSTQWEASHEVSFGSFQFTVQHPVVKKERMEVTLEGGFQYGQWSDNLRQSLNITSHTELTDRWTQNIWDEQAEDSIMVEVFMDYIFHNDITLETNTSSEFNSPGVLAGIEAHWEILPTLLFSVEAGSSVLSGEASFSGTGTDVDDIEEKERFTVYDMDGNLLSPPDETWGREEFLSGEFDFPEHTSSWVSMNYNLNVTASYRVTDMISLKAGYTYLLWKDLPMAPQWNYSDEFTKPYGPFALEEGWEKERRSNLSFSGFKLGMGLTF